MNIKTELDKMDQKRSESYQQNHAVKQVLLLEEQNAQKDLAIARALGKNNSIVRGLDEKGAAIELENLNGKYKGNVFTIDQIKNLAKKYNLTFLRSNHYCGNIPVETISKIKQFGKDADVELNDGVLSSFFYILAPDKCFNLEKIKKVKVDPDPAIFYKISDTKFRMIHQWGKDFSILNRINGFLFSSRETLTMTVMILGILLLSGTFHQFDLNIWWYAANLAIIMASLDTVGNSDCVSNSNFHEEKWDNHKRYHN